MNFLNIFLFVAVILAIFAGEAVAKKKGSGAGKAATKIGGKVAKGIAQEGVRQIANRIPG